MPFLKNLISFSALGENGPMNEDQLILDLVANRDLDTQSALLDALKDSGLNMTQPVLSRLLRKLGVRKIGGY